MNRTQQQLEGEFGAGRRRVWWAREGGLIEGSIQQGMPTFPQAIITGLGIAVGFAIINKIATRARAKV